MKKNIVTALTLLIAGCDNDGVSPDNDGETVVIEDEQDQEEPAESRMSIEHSSVKDDHRNPTGPSQLENLPVPPTEGGCKSGATEWTCDPRFCVEWQCIKGKWEWTCQCDQNGACWGNGGGSC